jgi:Hint domain/Bacterial Ig domain
MVAASELPITTNASAMDMAQTIFGDGVSVVSASYSGDNQSSGIYSNGDTVSPYVTPADTGVMLSTGRLSSFTNNRGDPNRSGSTSTNTSGVNNDADFNALAGASTYDASILDVDFIPDGDTMSLQFVFSSDEYPEYAGTIYNDIVGVWVNGQPVELSVGSGSTAVGTVNQTSNENLYVDNTGDAYNTEMDGFTVTMTLVMSVIPGVVNSIRVGVADVVDSSYDSTLLIAANSAQTALIAYDDTVSVAPGGTSNIDVTANDDGPGASTLYVTHINGIEVTAGDSITLTTGQMVTLNADGTLLITADLDEENVNFSYTVAAGNGASSVSDTAFVTINQVPCFVAGTLIATPDGEVAVERLAPGDMVLTKDNGPQPLRWVGARRVAAVGSLAPIRIAPDTFGAHRELLVSPQHRVLIHDALAELLFGDTEVLVAAKDLVNDFTVRPVEGGEVDYVHILFDEHQVVFSQGLATESFLPGPHTTRGFERAIVDEIRTIFPELDPDTGTGFPAAARRTLRRYEARLLMRQAGEAAA